MSHADALRSLWTDTCSVFTRSKARDETTGRMEFTESALFEDLPCRVSFKRVASADDSDNAAPLEQAVTLFLSVDVDIPPGSRVVVGRGGRSLEYHSSGEPAVYSSHQEIALESRGDWA